MNAEQVCTDASDVKPPPYLKKIKNKKNKKMQILNEQLHEMLASNFIIENLRYHMSLAHGNLYSVATVSVLSAQVTQFQN